MWEKTDNKNTDTIIRVNKNRRTELGCKDAIP